MPNRANLWQNQKPPSALAKRKRHRSNSGETGETSEARPKIAHIESFSRPTKSLCETVTETVQTKAAPILRQKPVFYNNDQSEVYYNDGTTTWKTIPKTEPPDSDEYSEDGLELIEINDDIVRASNSVGFHYEPYPEPLASIPLGQPMITDNPFGISGSNQQAEVLLTTGLSTGTSNHQSALTAAHEQQIATEIKMALVSKLHVFVAENNWDAAIDLITIDNIQNFTMFSVNGTLECRCLFMCPECGNGVVVPYKSQTFARGVGKQLLSREVQRGWQVSNTYRHLRRHLAQ